MIADRRSVFSPGWSAPLRRGLLAWYRQHARVLPWRRNTDPYQVWVSEVMLQQTQVVTVIPYFNRFVAAFPTVRALAEASEQSVLRQWEGLGYYRRARQLHRAARQCMELHDGAFPSEHSAVRALPGIGRYTAGAILSIAFDAREPILEANTVRLWSRLLAYRNSPYDSAGQQVLWQAAEQSLPRRGVGAFNQALMELGATICLPKSPRCDICPVANLCAARAAGLQAVIPSPKPRPNVEQMHEAAVVIRRKDEILLIERGESARWAGMWDFPRFPVTQHGGPVPNQELIDQELVERVRDMTGLEVRPVKKLAEIRHGVTRFRITLHCHEAQHLRKSRQTCNAPNSRWLKPSELAEYPLSVTGRKLSRMLVERG